MPTVIDSLIVELGLDPSKFEKGQKDAAAAFLKTKDKATQAGKDIEKSAKGMTEALGKATQGVFDLFAAFIGGRGLKEFVSDAQRANTSLGNLSASLGSSPQLISAWGIAAERMGGSAAATQASIQSLSDALVDFRTQGKALPDALFQLEAKSGKNIDFQHGWEKLSIDLANAASALAKTDPAAADRFLRSLGLDAATSQLLIQQGPRMRSYLEMMKRYAPSSKDIAASREMTDAWGKLSAQFGQLATKIGTAIAPMLEWLADKIGALVEAMARFVQAHPHWTEAITAMIGLLSAGGILLAIKNILALRSALLGLSAANAAPMTGGLLGLLARLGVVGAGLAAVGAVMNPTDLNSGENEVERQRQYGRGGSGSAGGAHPMTGNDALRHRGTGRNSGGGGGDGPKGGWWTPERQKHAYDVLRQNGVSERGAIALISRWANVESTGRGPTALNPSSGAYGIFQGLGPRKPRTNDFDEQLRMAAEQTRNAHGMGSGRIFDNAQDDAEAARGAAVFERAEGWNGRTDNYAGTTLRGMEAVRRHVLGKQSSLWNGGYRAGYAAARGGAAHIAALNSVSNDNRASTTSNSHEMHVGTINVNAPQATDAHGIAKHIDRAMASNMFASQANYGPA